MYLCRRIFGGNIGNSGALLTPCRGRCKAGRYHSQVFYAYSPHLICVCRMCFGQPASHSYKSKRRHFCHPGIL